MLWMNIVLILILFSIFYLSGNGDRQASWILYFGALSVYMLFLYLGNLLLRVKTAGIWIFAEVDKETGIGSIQKFRSYKYRVFMDDIEDMLFTAQKELIAEIQAEYPAMKITKVEIIK